MCAGLELLLAPLGDEAAVSAAAGRPVVTNDANAAMADEQEIDDEERNEQESDDEKGDDEEGDDEETDEEEGEGEEDKDDDDVLLLRAFEDEMLCMHFLEEPSIVLDAARIIRVGPPEQPCVSGIRQKSVGSFTTHGRKVVWAVDAGLVFARVCDKQGAWSPILQANTAYTLGRTILDHVGASKNTRISAPKFFGTKYFAELGEKRHTFPKPTIPVKCFSCSKIISGVSRYDPVTLARLCDSSGCRSRKRKAQEIDEDDG